MKVCAYLHVSRCLEPCGGVGRHANNLLKRLAQREGFEVSALYVRSALGPDGQPPRNFPLRDLPAHYLPGRELMLERVVRQLGLPPLDWFGPEADWYYSPMETRLPVRSARTAMTLHDVAMFEPDLPWSRTAAYLRARNTYGRWLPRTLTRVDRVLTVSEFSRQRMVELFGADPDRIHVVGNGVEDAFFAAGDAAATYGIDKCDEIVVLGGLRYKKGADHVLSVAEALHRRGSPLQIAVIGQSEPRYIARAAEYPNIQVLGMMPDAELVPRLARARASMLLSLYEGFGIPAIEAMACGTVAVVSDKASLPEIVGGAGLIFSPDRADEIAAALDQLCEDTAWHKDLVSRGRAQAKQYTWDRCVDRLIAALR